MQVIEMVRHGSQWAKVVIRGKRDISVVGAPGHNGAYTSVSMAVQTLKNAGYKSVRKYEVADDPEMEKSR